MERHRRDPSCGLGLPVGRARVIDWLTFDVHGVLHRPLSAGAVVAFSPGGEVEWQSVRAAKLTGSASDTVLVRSRDIDVHQGGDCVEYVEEEMGPQLSLEARELCLSECLLHLQQAPAVKPPLHVRIESKQNSQPQAREQHELEGFVDEDPQPGRMLIGAAYQVVYTMAHGVHRHDEGGSDQRQPAQVMAEPDQRPVEVLRVAFACAERDEHPAGGCQRRSPLPQDRLPPADCGIAQRILNGGRDHQQPEEPPEPKERHRTIHRVGSGAGCGGNCGVGDGHG